MFGWLSNPNWRISNKTFKVSKTLKVYVNLFFIRFKPFFLFISNIGNNPY